MAKLVCIRGDNKGDEFPLAEGATTIGRVGGNSVVLFDKKCSRFHCLIHKKGRYYALEDCGSTNGTRLNGKRITSDKNVSLKMGDRVRIGRTVLELSNKPLGNLVEQMATDVVADMQNHKFNRLMADAAKGAVKTPQRGSERTSFWQKLLGRDG